MPPLLILQKYPILIKIFTLATILFAIIGFVLISGYTAVRIGLTNTKGIIDTQTATFLQKPDKNGTYVAFPLAHTPEWIAFRQAVIKDLPLLQEISKDTGVPARLLVAILVPEQMRLFHTSRAIFKDVFAPLKILGSQSQFSFGIFGIKEDTAVLIESHLRDSSSPFYLGKAFEGKLSFSGRISTSTDNERFKRITDSHDHYYSYLYTALFVKQIETQWKKSGFPLDKNPAIIATLWNLGFQKSQPHADPHSGGAKIDINGTGYSFGALAESFYYSDEMVEIFPNE